MENNLRNSAHGTVYWITGLSGAGKTTIGTLLYNHIRKQKDNIVFLDGDILRQVFQNTDYSYEGRKNSALKYSGLCNMLAEQNIDVICCCIAMFDNCREWNRKNIRDYKEIYLKVPMDELVRRDQKQLYSRALRKEIKNVMGVDLDYEEPKNPDLVIHNDGSQTPSEVLNYLLNHIEKNKSYDLILGGFSKKEILGSEDDNDNNA